MGILKRFNYDVPTHSFIVPGTLSDVEKGRGYAVMCINGKTHKSHVSMEVRQLLSFITSDDIEHYVNAHMGDIVNAENRRYIINDLVRNLEDESGDILPTLLRNISRAVPIDPFQHYLQLIGIASDKLKMIASDYATKQPTNEEGKAIPFDSYVKMAANATIDQLYEVTANMQLGTRHTYNIQLDSPTTAHRPYMFQYSTEEERTKYGQVDRMIANMVNNTSSNPAWLSNIRVVHDVIKCTVCLYADINESSTLTHAVVESFCATLLLAIAADTNNTPVELGVYYANESVSNNSDDPITEFVSISSPKLTGVFDMFNSINQYDFELTTHYENDSEKTNS